MPPDAAALPPIRSSTHPPPLTRLRATQNLAAALAATPASAAIPTLATAVLNSLPTLRVQLLDASSEPIFAASCDVLAHTAEHLVPHHAALAAPLAALTPLLVDQAACAATAASAIGAHAHTCACAVLPRLPGVLLADALAAAIAALARAPTGRAPGASATPPGALPHCGLAVAHPPAAAARQMLCEVALLTLLLGALGDPTAGVPPPLKPAAVARPLCGVLHDGHASTRRMTRHALLVLMERFPRAVAEPFGRLPLRTQLQLTAAARSRARALGPPLLPPPLARAPARTPQAVVLQARARGRAARRRAAVAAAFVRGLKPGDQLRVLADGGGGHAGTLRFHGACSFAPGTWLGVELDGPWGRHDGALKGERHFKCQPRHGLFVRPSGVTPFDGWPRPAARRAGGGTGAVSGAAADAGLSASEVAPHALSAVSPPTPQAVAPPTPRARALDANPADSVDAPLPPLRTLLASHRGVLGNAKQLVDGQLTLLRTHELAARVQGEGQRDAYLAQMEMLCAQQRLLACQLHDIVLEQKRQAAAEEGRAD